MKAIPVCIIGAMLAWMLVIASMIAQVNVVVPKAFGSSINDCETDYECEVLGYRE